VVLLDLYNSDKEKFPRVRSRGLKAVGSIKKGAWVQQYAGVAMSDAAANRLQQEHPDRAWWLVTVESKGLKINGCPGDVKQMAKEDWLASLANHSDEPTCELVPIWVCSPITGIAPALFLRALDDLNDGCDITWNYGASAEIHHKISKAPATAAAAEGLAAAGSSATAEEGGGGVGSSMTA
jgi:hypothetical protein